MTINADAPVKQVRVMEDRAQVTRVLRLSLESGFHSVVVSGITPLIGDRTLRARLSNDREETNGTTGARVLDLTVNRDFVIRSRRPESVRDITCRIEAAKDAYMETFDRASSLFHERELVKEAGQGLATHICDRLAVGPFDSQWKTAIDRVWEKREEIEDTLLALQWEQDDRQILLKRLEAERIDSAAAVPEYRADIRTEIQVFQEGTYLIEWEYQVPCAVWRPDYTAALERKNEHAVIEWESAGMVWQATGEDWKDVELSFSTDRPSLGAELPFLQDDVLRIRDKSREETEAVEVTSRDQVIETTQKVSDDRQTDTPPGIDDGGETRTFRVPGTVTVISDGCPLRLPFERWSEPADTELVTFPEKADFVFLASVQNNPSGMPLLAGPVSLVREGGYMGRSQIGYIAPGEQFTLSWGSEDGIRVVRDVSKKQQEKGLLKHRHYMFRVNLYITNLSKTEHRLTISERIPVSELKQVEIRLVPKMTTEGFTKDDQGILSWKTLLKPGAEETLTLAYDVEMPRNVNWSA